MSIEVNVSFDLRRQNYSTKNCGVDNSSGLKICLAVYIGSLLHTEHFQTFLLHFSLILVYVHQINVFGSCVTSLCFFSILHQESSLKVVQLWKSLQNFCILFHFVQLVFECKNVSSVNNSLGSNISHGTSQMNWIWNALRSKISTAHLKLIRYVSMFAKLISYQSKGVVTLAKFWPNYAKQVQPNILSVV